jgi:hypothetical protein
MTNPKSLFLIGLDYELYFGHSTGSVAKCMIEPTQRICDVLEQHNARVTLFVDAGYLSRCLALSKTNSYAGEQYDLVAAQLRQLVEKGHDVQLHIHPHWEDCHLNGQQWHMNVSRYKLHDHSADKIEQIVKTYKQTLQNITGTSIFAYRAGGWCIQPFSDLRNALSENEIWLDSTIYAGGYSQDPHHGYDFRTAPDSDLWCFDGDPLETNANGGFVELPITPCALGPTFFWQLAFYKKFGSGKYKTMGDGSPVASSNKYYLSKLLKPSTSVASVDGIKGRWLKKTFLERKAAGRRVFNIMGHPKALSEESLIQLDLFLAEFRSELQLRHFGDLKSLRNEASLDKLLVAETSV